MDYTPNATSDSRRITTRFAFLAEALNGNGGFAPLVNMDSDLSGMKKPVRVASYCHLVPYPRENAQKFAARAAVAVYENHLRSACENFTGYIARRKPQRDTGANPLFDRMVDDADWAGNNLDVFWQSFMLDAKARGSMLLLIEMPSEQGMNQADTLNRRLVPYLTAISPDRLCDYRLNERKQFAWVRISDNNYWNGRETIAVERYWDDRQWRVYQGNIILEQGPHNFGQCPVLAFTELGAYPCVGEFAQIADLSKRIYNARSELDEILRGQTFSVLAYQVPQEQRNVYQSLADSISATIGTNNMLVHEGLTPSFIAPPDGPATIYGQVIDALHESISRIGYSVQQHQTSKAQESGLSLVVRFQSLNGALSRFARRMQDLEMRMWSIAGAALGMNVIPTAQWATDYSIADTERELAILTAMQATGFPERALIEQRKHIASETFGSLDESELFEVMAAIEEAEQETAAVPGQSQTDGGALP